MLMRLINDSCYYLGKWSLDVKRHLVTLELASEIDATQTETSGKGLVTCKQTKIFCLLYQ